MAKAGVLKKMLEKNSLAKYAPQEAQMQMYMGDTLKEAGVFGDVSKMYRDKPKGIYIQPGSEGTGGLIDASKIYKGEIPREEIQRDISKASERAKRQGRVMESRRDRKPTLAKKIKGIIGGISKKVDETRQNINAFANEYGKKSGEYKKKIKDGYNTFVNKHSNKPNEFQQQTTEMINNFSGGKYTEDVNTEKMNWLQAGAHKDLHKSVAQDYNNLIAKMQGAKDQESLSKIMSDNEIAYKEGMSAADIEKNIRAHFDERINAGPGFTNYIRGNRVASTAAVGVAGVSALALADSKGKRSNSDLYSSQV